MRLSFVSDASVCALALCAILTASPLSSHAVEAQEWTRFRGPNGTGVVESAGIPVTWTADDYNWVAKLPGLGHSCPVLWGDRIFLTSASEDGTTRTAICLDTTGKILWTKEYDGSPHTKHERNSFATPTPAVDADHVYVAWSSPEEYAFIALDHEGNEVWRRNLGLFKSQHSCGTSPVVFEDLIILGNDQDGESFLLAVDRMTGKTVWQTPRKTNVVAYSTPCLYHPPSGPPELIFNSGAHGITSVEPWTGKVNWEISVFDKRSVSSPYVAAGLIFGSCGSGGGGNYVVAVKPGTADGKVQPAEAYRIDKSAPYVPTGLVHGDRVFLWADNGVVTCINAADGEVVWRKRVGGNFSGSPICVNDRLYCVSDDGEVMVLRAGEEFEELGKIPLGEECRSTPAVADGRLYIRTVSQLFSIGGKK
ncbi:MAG: PQQ-binding-like beta-propeller repeat protein [Pirellulales bacterium]|nr:PQQ-binding-like beta-propeller repeat protein [Pirellulales bacterium]